MVRRCFDGLCLDYLDSCKPKLGNSDMDYWLHATLKEYELVKGCRFLHKQPTRYFSFSGRKEERDRMVGKKNISGNEHTCHYRRDSEDEDLEHDDA